MTYSLDFRQKVLAIKRQEGLSLDETAKRFGIGSATVSRWLNRPEPKRHRNKPATKIDMDALAKDIEHYPDAYMHERAERLGVSKSGIGHALKRLGVSRKKKPVSSESQRRYTSIVSRSD